MNAAPTRRPDDLRGPGTAGPAAAVRGLVALGGLLVRRRARRDLALLGVMWCLVTVSVLALVTGPRLAERAVADALQQAVTDAGTQAHLTLYLGIGADPFEAAAGNQESPRAVWQYARELDERVPPAIRATLGQTVVTVASREHYLLRVRGTEVSIAESETTFDLAAVVGAEDAVDVVDGRLPRVTGPDERFEIALPEPTATRLGLRPGDEVGVSGFDLDFDFTEIPVVLVGVLAAHDPDAALWMHLDDPWSYSAGEAGGARATAFVAEDTMTDLVASYSGTADAAITLVPDPAAMDPADAAQVLAEVAVAEDDVTRLAGSLGGRVRLATGLTEVLQQHQAAARAAAAQMSVPQTGVAAVACVVLVLLAGLLVAGRAGVLGLERARGSSVAAIGLRLGTEQAVLVSLAAGTGVALAQLLVPGPFLDPGPPVAVGVAALLATPLLGAWTARRAWAGQRSPANRRDRARLARHRAVRRAVAETGVVVAAVAAVVSLRGRGLLDAGPDPFLSAAPVLVGLLAALVVVRLLPVAVRPLAVLGRRGTGALGLVGASRTGRAVAVLPILALTLGTSVAVTCAVLVDTVRTGQVQASWDRVGADARVDGLRAPDVAAAAVGAPGVAAVGSALVHPELFLDLGSTSTTVTVLGIDAGYVDLVGRVPGAGDDLDALAGLVADSAGAAAGGEAIPAVVDAAVAEMLGEVPPAVAINGRYYPLDVVGTTDHRPVGQYPGPFVLIDRAALGEAGETPEPTSTWVLGPGADDAVGDPSQTVTTRSGWLAERRQLEQFAGVERLLLLATLAALVLSAVGLAATVVAGAGERGRTLAMLRTLGMRARAGWWLALAEVAPVVVGAVVAGGLTGVLVVALLGDALGLAVLTGGPHQPVPTLAPSALLALGAGAVVLVGLAMATEVLTHRRDRLAEVLRVGG